MRKIFFLGLIYLTVFLISCSKEDDKISGSFNREEWLKYADTTSEYMILIPDIQYYTQYSNYLCYLDTIIARINDLNSNGFRVKAVLQTGDITNNDIPGQWSNAQEAFSGLDSSIPFIMCAGNHDFGENGHCDSRSTYYSDYFDYSGYPSFVCSFEHGNYDNSCFRVSIFNQSFLVFSLEFGPADDVISWADSIAAANDGETAIVLTHAYLYADKQRLDYSESGDVQYGNPYEYPIASVEKVNDGKDLWQKLISPNRSIRFVMCGHMSFPSYAGQLISSDSYGNACLQMLFDAQSFANGGDGWIQILEFKNDMKTVRIMTYSATKDKWMTGTTCQYSFVYN
jgi:hypothetical protein